MLNPEYVIGLVDGEGSFYIRVNEDPKRRNQKIDAPPHLKRCGLNGARFLDAQSVTTH